MSQIRNYKGVFGALSDITPHVSQTWDKLLLIEFLLPVNLDLDYNDVYQVAYKFTETFTKDGLKFRVWFRDKAVYDYVVETYTKLILK